MFFVLRLCFVVFIGTIVNSASAEIYQWTDDDGKIHFSDSPPEKVKTKKVTLQINSFTSPDVESFKFNPALISKRKISKDVVMYGTTWCGVCKKAKRYFEHNGIGYKEYDVEKSDKGKKDFKKLNGRGVPIILVGNQRMNGFSAASFEKMYRR